MQYKIFAQRTVLIFLANLIVGLSGIILLPILTKNLSINDYGIWVQVNATISLVPIFIVMGLPSYSMVRFLSGEQNKEKIQNGFYSIAFVILVTGFLVSSLFFIFAGPISQILFAGNTLISQILSLIIILSSLNILFQYFFITFQQIKRYSFLLCLKAIINVLFVSSFILLDKGIIGAVTGLLCSELMFSLITFSIISSEIGIIFPKFTELKEYLSLSIPAIPSSLSYWVVDSSDRYLIGIFLGVSAVGYYSPGYSLGAVVAMIAAPVTSILTSALSKSYNEENKDEVKVLLEYSIKYYLFIAIPAVIGLSVLSKPLLAILSTSEIANVGYFVTPFVGMGFLLLGLNNIIVNMLILEKITKIIGITWIITALINLALTIFLIQIFGIIGAAISTLVAYIIPFIILAYYSFKFIKLDLNYVFFIKIILSSAVIIFMYFLWVPSGILSILLFILTSVILYLILVVLLKAFNKEEVSFIKSFFKVS